MTAGGGGRLPEAATAAAAACARAQADKTGHTRQLCISYNCPVSLQFVCVCMHLYAFLYDFVCICIWLCMTWYDSA